MSLMAVARKKRKILVLPPPAHTEQTCVRCGYCCIALSLVVIREEAGALVPYRKLPGRVCPHLVRASADLTTCAVHAAPWYVRTSCFAHKNPLLDPDVCDDAYWMCQGPRLVHLALEQASSPGWEGLERLVGVLR